MPEISILIPALQAEQTLEDCLRSIALQTYRDFEVILIVSGGGRAPTLGGLDVNVKVVSVAAPLLPHSAINRGLQEASGRVLVFTDADAYPEPDWLEKLLAGRRSLGPVVYGGVACHGSGWIVEGAHLSKFDKWLPGGDPRELKEGPTVNLLIERPVFEGLGGFMEGTIHADTDLSWRLREAGYSLWFHPAAVVRHHHLHSWGSLVRERFRRGRTFVEFERRRIHRSRPRAALRAIASLAPLRLANQLVRAGRNAAQAGMTARYLKSFPVLAGGLYAWLVGEAYELTAAALAGDREGRPPASTTAGPDIG